MRSIDVESEPKEIRKVLLFKAYSSAIVKWYQYQGMSLYFCAENYFVGIYLRIRVDKTLWILKKMNPFFVQKGSLYNDRGLWVLEVIQTYHQTCAL